MIKFMYFTKRKFRPVFSHTGSSVVRSVECSGSKDSLSVESHRAPTRGAAGECCKRLSPLAPLARPESAIDDSDIEDSGPNRISSTWKDFNLAVVPQSTDCLLSPKSGSSPYSRNHSGEPFYAPSPTVSHKSSLSSMPREISPTPVVVGTVIPPPKPPRTFATEETRIIPIRVENPPPKPPRTYEYVNLQSTNASAHSLDWDFQNGKPLTRSSGKPSQTSFPVNFSPTSPGPTSPVGHSLGFNSTYSRTIAPIQDGYRETVLISGIGDSGDVLENRTVPANTVDNLQFSSSPSTTAESRVFSSSSNTVESGFVNGLNTLETRTFGSSSSHATTTFSYTVSDTQVTYLQDKASVTKLTNGREDPTFSISPLYGMSFENLAHGICDMTADTRSMPAVNGGPSLESLNKSPVRDAIYRRSKLYDHGPVYRPPLPGTYCTSDEKLTDREKKLQKSASLSHDATQVVTRRTHGNRNRNKRHAIYFDSDETSNLLQYSCSCSDIPDRPPGSPVEKNKRGELEQGLLESFI